MASLGDALAKFDTLFHNQVLLATYMGPAVTKGGIIRPDKTRDEDKWQGKVGMVVKKGTLAFEGLPDDAEVGDWLVYRISDGFPIDINEVHCRIIEDKDLHGRVTDPTIIY